MATLRFKAGLIDARKAFIKLVRVKRNSSTATTSSIDELEKKKFDSASDSWWLLDGERNSLHSLNEIRVPLVRDGLVDNVAKNPKPLNGFSILDVGCGGGILCEPLARLGAQVTGIDMCQNMIDAASRHAALDSSLAGKLNYKLCTVEEHLAEQPEPYDAIIASEVIEHVNNVPALVQSCVQLTKDEGSLFFTTINRTPLARFLAIFAAENILKIVPKGTHDYEKFVSPQELSRELILAGCRVKLLHGMMYNPFSNTWFWIRNTDVCYALQAVKLKKNLK